MADRKDREALERWLDAIESSIERATSDELQEDIRAEGRDPEQVATATRSVFAEVAKDFHQKRLHAARKARELALQAYETQQVRLPATAQARRTLLQQVIARNPNLTLQFRDLDHHSDEDIESALRHLAVLGLLADTEE